MATLHDMNDDVRWWSDVIGWSRLSDFEDGENSIPLQKRQSSLELDADEGASVSPDGVVPFSLYRPTGRISDVSWNSPPLMG